MFCVWMVILCVDGVMLMYYYMFVCGIKSGYVVIFFVGDDATVRIVATR